MVDTMALDMEVVSLGGNWKPETLLEYARKRKMARQTFRLKSTVYMTDVTEGRFAFECDSPVLDVTEDRILDVDV